MLNRKRSSRYVMSSLAAGRTNYRLPNLHVAITKIEMGPSASPRPLCRVLAHRVSSSQRIKSVAIGGIADMPRCPVADLGDVNDHPKRTSDCSSGPRQHGRV